MQVDLSKNSKPLLSAVALNGRLFFRMFEGESCRVIAILPGCIAMPTQYSSLEEVAALETAQPIYQGQRGEVVF